MKAPQPKARTRNKPQFTVVLSREVYAAAVSYSLKIDEPMSRLCEAGLVMFLRSRGVHVESIFVVDNVVKANTVKASEPSK
jgi:hypothetical protein